MSVLTRRPRPENLNSKNVPKQKKCSGTFSFLVREILISLAPSQPISQIDAVPTLLSLLHFKYTGEFYGTNALDPDYVSRLFLSNYQKLAYVKGNEMVIMRPVRGVHFYRDGQQIGSAEAAKPQDRVKAPDASLQQVLDEGISYYQHSARWREFLKE